MLSRQAQLSVYLFTDAQRQLEQLLHEAQLLAALVQEAQQLSNVQAVRVLPK